MRSSKKIISSLPLVLLFLLSNLLTAQHKVNNNSRVITNDILSAYKTALQDNEVKAKSFMLLKKELKGKEPIGYLNGNWIVLISMGKVLSNPTVNRKIEIAHTNNLKMKTAGKGMTKKRSVTPSSVETQSSTRNVGTNNRLASRDLVGVALVPTDIADDIGLVGIDRIMNLGFMNDFMNNLGEFRQGFLGGIMVRIVISAGSTALKDASSDGKDDQSNDNSEDGSTNSDSNDVDNYPDDDENSICHCIMDNLDFKLFTHSNSLDVTNDLIPIYSSIENYSKAQSTNQMISLDQGRTFNIIIPKQ